MNSGFGEKFNILFVTVFLLGIGLSPAYSLTSAQSPGSPLDQEGGDPESNSKILVEIFLSQDHLNDLNSIKGEFKTFNITHVKPQFFKLGSPPQNIAIGNHIPVSVARLAIHLAQTYNKGIHYILPEERIAENYVAIGTSMFDERIPVPITPSDLSRLADPSLTTSQFHSLYRHLTREDQR